MYLHGRNMGVVDFLAAWVTKRQERVPLWQVFHGKPQLARVARLNFEKVLARRGVTASDAFWRKAQAVSQDPNLTIGQFLDAQAAPQEKVKTPRKRRAR
jgi:hypothetical protein